MSASSCAKTLGNVIANIEHMRDHIIQDNMYHIVRIEGVDIETTRSHSIKYLETQISGVSPLAVYYFNDVIFLFFPFGSKPFRGRYNEIISYFTNDMTLKTQKPRIKCNIIEFPTKQQLVVYVLYNIHKFFLEFVLSISPNTTEDDILEKTLYEINEMLLHERIELSGYPDIQKYGEYLRIKTNQQDTKRSGGSSLSGIVGNYDMNNIDTYIKFIFQG